MLAKRAKSSARLIRSLMSELVKLRARLFDIYDRYMIYIIQSLLKSNQHHEMLKWNEHGHEKCNADISTCKNHLTEAQMSE